MAQITKSPEAPVGWQAGEYLCYANRLAIACSSDGNVHVIPAVDQYDHIYNSPVMVQLLSDFCTGQAGEGLGLESESEDPCSALTLVRGYPQPDASPCWTSG